MIDRFEQVQLMRRLASLRPAHRVAFATACARRLAAAATCAEPAGESPVVVKTREFLDVLQSVAEGSESTVSDLPEALAACLALLPENEDDLDDSGGFSELAVECR